MKNTKKEKTMTRQDNIINNCVRMADRETPGHSNILENALSTLLEQRYSCRAYLSTPVPTTTIGKVLQMAQRTASWSNAQPWQIIITTGEATDRFRTALTTYAHERSRNPDFPWPKEYRNAYLARRRECGFQLYNAVGIARGDREAAARQSAQNFELFGAPHVAIITTDEALGVYGAIDCGAYVSNFMLAAQSLGVASIAQAALGAHPSFIRDHFELGEDRQVICGISFGYKDDHHPVNGFRTSRADLEEVVTWAR